jgi:hypothetical protein
MKFVKEIITNAYMIKVGALWEANTNIQWCNLFSIHMIVQVVGHHISQKLVKLSPMNFKPSLKKVKMEIFMQNKRIKKICNVFPNTQQSTIYTYIS